MERASIIFIIAALTLMTGCQKAEDTAAEKSAIKAVLDTYVRSIENEDIELYARIFEHDSDMVNFGSAATQRIVGWDALRKVIDAQNPLLSGTKITQSDVSTNVSPEGRFAWATSMWNFKATIGAQAIELPVRCTWILEKRDKDWKIVHFHKSVGTAS
jgi:uncharacterized protein (TIGR02246 family)